MIFVAFIGLAFALKDGSLGGYFTLEEIKDYLEDLAESRSDSSVSEVQGVSIFHFGTSTSAKKAKILIFGGFHAGLPMAAYEVIFTLEEFTENDLTHEEIKNDFLTDFIPVINIEAYRKMEEEWNNENVFKTYMTDLTGLNSASFDCDPDDGDYGINPDRNFDFMFGEYNEKCSSDYNGNAAFESSVTTIVDFTSYDYVINFQADGRGKYRPYATNQKTLTDDNYFYYYNTIEIYDPLSSLNSYTGTLMDYLYDVNEILSIQLGVGDSSEPDKDDAEEDSKFIYDTLKATFGMPKVDYLGSNYSDGSSYDYDDLVDFRFVVRNTSPYRIHIQIKDDFDVDDDYERLFYDTYLVEKSNDNEEFNHYETNITTIEITVEPSSELTIHYNYGVDSIDNATFECALQIESLEDSFYFSTEILRTDVSVEIPEDEEDDFVKRVIVGIGLALVFVLVLFSIVYFVLIKKKDGLIGLS